VNLVRYTASIGNQTFTINIEETPKGQVISLNGQSLAVDLCQVTPPWLYSLLIDGRSFEVFAEETKDGYRIVIGGEMYLVQVASERESRLAAVARPVVRPTGEITIKAPMPGLVVAVPVAPGDTVHAGQELVILEAMKMENEIRTPQAGIVRAVHVAPGQKVEQGQTLAVVG